MRVAYVAGVGGVIVLAACLSVARRSLHPSKPLPQQSYVRPAEQPFKSSDYVFKLGQMETFYDVPGEFGHVLEGQKYGFESLSFIVTETHPGGGPPLHTHDTEEAHVLLDGKARYVIGNQTFAAEGPYIAKVPPNTPHTFVNTGRTFFRLVAVFPSKRPSYTELGKNPLTTRSGQYTNDPLVAARAD